MGPGIEDDRVGLALSEEHKVEPKRPVADTLQAYAEGMIGRDEAIRRVGVRDYADLLVALGDAGLSPPRPPKHQIENEAATFSRIWEST